jgi:hypothetical protein
VPVAHGAQLVAVPDALAKVPTGQGAQVLAPALAPNWPAAHCAQLVAPELGWYKPAAQSLHEVALL